MTIVTSTTSSCCSADALAKGLCFSLVPGRPKACSQASLLDNFQSHVHADSLHVLPKVIIIIIIIIIIHWLIN